MIPQFLQVIREVQAKGVAEAAETAPVGGGSAGDHLLTQELKRLRVDIERAPLVAIESALHELSWDTPHGCFGNTSAIVHILASVRDQQLNSQSPLFMKGASNFLRDCDGTKIAINESEFEIVCERLSTAVTRMGPVWCQIAALPVLSLLGKRLQLDGPHSEPRWRSFSNLHTYTIKVLLGAGFIDLAASLADEGVSDLAQRRDGTSHPQSATSLSVMEYYYQCGEAYVKMRRYRDALDAYGMVLSTPSHSFAKIHLEARTRQILCGLIATGDLPALPSATSYAVKCALDKAEELVPYLVFAKMLRAPAALSVKAASVLGEAEAGRKGSQRQTESLDLEQFGSLGVVAREAYENRQLVALTSTYVSLSLTDLASASSAKRASLHACFVGLPNLTPQDAEAQIVRMIKDGQVTATIDHRSSAVRFVGHQDRDEKQRALDLESEIKRLVEACQDLADMDARVTKSKTYLAGLARKETQASPQDPWLNSGAPDSP